MSADLRSPNQKAISQGLKFTWKRKRALGGWAVKKPRARRKNPEQKLHLDVAKFLHLALRPPVFWTTFPAGGGGRLRGAFLNGMGLKAGVPDILIFCPTPIRTIGIELKAGRGELSSAQIETHADLSLAGVRCRVARSIEGVENILVANGVPIHARVAGGYLSRKAKAPLCGDAQNQSSTTP